MASPYVGAVSLLGLALALPSGASPVRVSVPSWQFTRDPTPLRVPGVGAERVSVLVLAADGNGNAIVAAGPPGEVGVWPNFQEVSIDPARTVDLFGGCPGVAVRVFAATRASCGIVAATSRGLVRIAEGKAQPLGLFVGVFALSGIEPEPCPFPGGAQALSLDGAANLWCANRGAAGFNGYGGFTVFPTDPAAWQADSFTWQGEDSYVGALTGVLNAAGPALDRTARYPPLLRWRAPFQAMAGDPRGVGLWVYGARRDGATDVVHVDATFPRPFPHEDPPSAVPAGVLVPVVADAKLAAGMDGRVWLAGDTLEGSRVYVFDGKAFTEVTPANDRLKGRRFTQLLMAKNGDLYAATDGVGVLVYDGKAWREHPVNADLPTLEGTGIKPVSCIDLDPNLGYLWVGTDNNVICWRPDERP